MGCWGYGIMESDGALDFELEFNDIAGISSEEQNPRMMRRALEAHLEQLFERARNEPVFENYTQFRAEAYQVLAVMLMRAGCALSNSQHIELLNGLRDCSEYAEARVFHQAAGALGRGIEPQDLEAAGIEAEHNGYTGIIERMVGRIAAVEQLYRLVQNYVITGGLPVAVSSKGLFEVMAERAANGTTPVNATKGH